MNALLSDPLLFLVMVFLVVVLCAAVGYGLSCLRGIERNTARAARIMEAQERGGYVNLLGPDGHNTLVRRKP